MIFLKAEHLAEKDEVLIVPSRTGVKRVQGHTGHPQETLHSLEPPEPTSHSVALTYASESEQEPGQREPCSSHDLNGCAEEQARVRGARRRALRSACGGFGSSRCSPAKGDMDSVEAAQGTSSSPQRLEEGKAGHSYTSRWWLRPWAAQLRISAGRAGVVPSSFWRSRGSQEPPETCPETPLYQTCQIPMVTRTNRMTKEEFYGCLRFPACRETLSKTYGGQPAAVMQQALRQSEAAKVKSQTGYADPSMIPKTPGQAATAPKAMVKRCGPPLQRQLRSFMGACAESVRRRLGFAGRTSDQHECEQGGNGGHSRSAERKGATGEVGDEDALGAPETPASSIVDPARTPL